MYEWYNKKKKTLEKCFLRGKLRQEKTVRNFKYIKYGRSLWLRPYALPLQTIKSTILHSIWRFDLNNKHSPPKLSKYSKLPKFFYIRQ